MCANTLWWRHLVNACEVKARPDRIVGKFGTVCFLQPTHSVLNLVVATVQRDSVCAVSLLPCVSESCYMLYVVYCMLVRLSGCLIHLQGKIIIICPIAIAYSMRHIIKSVCVCQCICPSERTLTVAFLYRFSPKLAQT